MASLRKYVLNLGASGGGDDIRKLDVSGPIVAVLDSSSAFQISCDSEAPIPCERGLKFIRPFNFLTVQNLSSGANVVTLLIGDGDVQDYRPTAKQQIASLMGTLFGGTVTQIVATSAALISAADPTRVELIITANTTNTGQVLLEGEQTVNKRICAVFAGQTFRINYTGAVYLWSTNGTDIATVYCSKY